MQSPHPYAQQTDRASARNIPRGRRLHRGTDAGASGIPSRQKQTRRRPAMSAVRQTHDKKNGTQRHQLRQGVLELLLLSPVQRHKKSGIAAEYDKV